LPRYANCVSTETSRAVSKRNLRFEKSVACFRDNMARVVRFDQSCLSFPSSKLPSVCHHELCILHLKLTMTSPGLRTGGRSVDLNGQHGPQSCPMPAPRQKSSPGRRQGQPCLPSATVPC
jgi:hypothetical protein